MNPIPFIVATYGVTFVLTGALLFVSWRNMVKAEGAARDL